MVRFENVGLRYGLGPEVLRDLTFRIEPHSFQFLTGPSGAGKTSLLRLLFLSLKPTRGLITQFGHDVATLSKDAVATLRRRVGTVFQDFRLVDHLSSFDNVALPLRVLSRCARERDNEKPVADMLDWVGLSHRARTLALPRCRAASSSASPSPARSSPVRKSSWRTSRPATSIPKWRSSC